MKRTWLLLVLIAALLLTGCQGDEETVQSNESTYVEAPCYYGACIKSIYSSVKDGYFAVLFDVTPIEGIADPNTAPQFTTPLTIRVESMEGEAYINQVFTQEDYYCYVGKDVPWSPGQYTALCGIGIEMVAGEDFPAADEHILVTMPEYDDYQVEVIVGDSW
jgi:hypothetical protein